MDKLEITLKDSLGDRLSHPSDAYQFVLDALQFTLKSLDQPRHVSAKELLNGIREYAVKSYGPMTRSVLEHWNVKCCEDFGKIVFQLIEARLVAKQESDQQNDFKEGYDFSEVF